METLLGAHISTKGGVENSVDIANSININTMQIFTQSSRKWVYNNISDNSIEKFKKNRNKIKKIVSHASYLINLASENIEIINKSIENLNNEIQNCIKLGIDFIVLHPGSSKDKKSGIEKIGESLNKILKESIDKYNNKIPILIETSAGQGNSIGSTFEELKEIINYIENKELTGICIDTCHIWAAGYKFQTKTEYEDLFYNIDKILSIKNIKTIHINNSSKTFNSRVDRHANILEGTIDIKSFELIMNDKNLINIPKIIETPKDDINNDIKNIDILKSLIK